MQPDKVPKVVSTRERFLWEWKAVLIVLRFGEVTEDLRTMKIQPATTATSTHLPERDSPTPPDQFLQPKEGRRRERPHTKPSTSQVPTNSSAQYPPPRQLLIKLPKRRKTAPAKDTEQAKKIRKRRGDCRIRRQCPKQRDNDKVTKARPSALNSTRISQDGTMLFPMMSMRRSDGSFFLC